MLNRYIDIFERSKSYFRDRRYIGCHKHTTIIKLITLDISE